MLADVGYFIPELVLILSMCTALLLEANYDFDEKGRVYVYTSAGIGLFIAFALLVCNLKISPVSIFTRAAVIDPFSTFVKIILILGSLGTLYLSYFSRDMDESVSSEFVAISLGALVGAMILASANNLLMVYLGIEILSILSYVLASLKKQNTQSSEAGLKYVLYGGLASGIMLFGAAHVYGVTKSIHFHEIMAHVSYLPSDKGLILLAGLLCFFVGLGYKMSAAPFHMWTPDVYEGSPVVVTTFFAVVPKIAALAALTRITFVFFGQHGNLQSSWLYFLQLIAALTMTLGNVTAIGQTSIKRMLAFSSVSHAGVMMLGVLVIDVQGTSAILFYALSYIFMNLVAFTVVSIMIDHTGNDHFDRFYGLGKRYPFVALLMALVMFSFAGIPPFSGFVAKFNIISAIVERRYYGIAIIAVLNSVISLYYYIKIVRFMYLRDPEGQEKIAGFNFQNQAVLFLLTLPVVFLGLFWDKICVLAQGAKIFIDS